MRLVGALAFALCAFFAVGLATGKAPRLRLRLGSSKPKAEISNRQIWLTQAGLDLNPTQYYFGLGLVALITFAVVSAITATPIVALAPTVVAVILPHVFFDRRRLKSVQATQNSWPDAIREVISSIEANSSLHNALVSLSYKGPEPLRPAFDRFPMLSATVGVVPALESVRERLGDPASDRVIEILILAHERGGAVVTEILRDLARSTQEDLQLADEIVTSQLEQKINSRAVFALPWLVLILLVLSNSQFRAFYQSFGGFLTVVGGAFLSLFGMFIMSRLAKAEVEPRVFGGSAIARNRDSVA